MPVTPPEMGRVRLREETADEEGSVDGRAEAGGRGAPVQRAWGEPAAGVLYDRDGEPSIRYPSRRPDDSAMRLPLRELAAVPSLRLTSASVSMEKKLRSVRWGAFISTVVESY